MKKKLLIAEIDGFSDEVIQLLSQYFEVTAKNLYSEDIQHAFDTFDIFWFRLGFKIDSKLLAQSDRKVSTIVCPVTGLDHIDIEYCNSHNIKVISLKNEIDFLKNIRATAELTLALTLNILRKINPATNDVKHGHWNRDLFKGNEIYQKKVAIIGYGRLGQIVADLFDAFGAEVVVYDSKPITYSKYAIAHSIQDVLKDCYICSLHISYTKENMQYFNHKKFEMMPYGSVFINTSRGSLVDENALVENFKSGRIKAIAADVLHHEPEINQSILYEFYKNNPTTNIIITPHIGGNTHESFYKTERFVAEKLIQHFKFK